MWIRQLNRGWIIIQKVFQYVIVGEFKGTDERPFGDFLKVKPNRHKTCKRFNALQRRSFKHSQYPGGSSSLHFVEDFHVVQYRSFIVKPQLETV